MISHELVVLIGSHHLTTYHISGGQFVSRNIMTWQDFYQALTWLIHSKTCFDLCVCIHCPVRTPNCTSFKCLAEGLRLCWRILRFSIVPSTCISVMYQFHWQQNVHRASQLIQSSIIIMAKLTHTIFKWFQMTFLSCKILSSALSFFDFPIVPCLGQCCDWSLVLRTK